MADPIPATSAAYDAFFKNIVQYVEQQCTGASPRWTHLPGSGPSPIEPPKYGPVFTIVQLGPGALGTTYQDGERQKGSRPKHVNGARIYYGVFGEPVTDQTQLSASVWATKCPHIVRFRETDRGTCAYFALKWEISKENGESPWSEIQSEIIP